MKAEACALLGGIFRVVVLDLLLDLSEPGVARELVLLARVQGVLGAFAPLGFDFVAHGLIDFRRHERPLRLPGLLPELLDGGNDLLAAVVTVLNRFQHRFLRRFFGVGFDHDDSVHGCRDRDVDVRVGDFFVGRIEHPVGLADPRDTHGPRGQHDRDIGNRDRRGSADHGVDAGVVAGVRGEHVGDDLRLRYESRPERAAATAGRSSGW